MVGIGLDERVQRLDRIFQSYFYLPACSLTSTDMCSVWQAVAKPDGRRKVPNMLKTAGDLVMPLC